MAFLVLSGQHRALVCACASTHTFGDDGEIRVPFFGSCAVRYTIAAVPSLCLPLHRFEFAVRRSHSR